MLAGHEGGCKQQAGRELRQRGGACSGGGGRQPTCALPRRCTRLVSRSCRSFATRCPYSLSPVPLIPGSPFLLQNLIARAHLQSLIRPPGGMIMLPITAGEEMERRPKPVRTCCAAPSRAF